MQLKALLLLVCVPSCNAGTMLGSITATATLGGKACHVLTIPRPWKVPANLKVKAHQYSGQDPYEMRVPRGAPPGVVLITKRSSFPTTLSADKYRVDLTGRKQPVRVSEKEWMSATPQAIVTSGLPDQVLQLTQEKNSFSYRGHEYFRKGRYWAAVGSDETRVSLEGTWLSVQSFHNLKPPPAGPEVSPERDYGEYYIEVYNSNSGDKKLDIHGNYEYWDASTVFGGLLFVGDRFLFLSTDADDGLKSLVCDLERADEK